MDPNLLQKSPRELLKGLGKVLLESSRALSNMAAPGTYYSESEEESDKGECVHNAFRVLC